MQIGYFMHRNNTTTVNVCKQPKVNTSDSNPTHLHANRSNRNTNQTRAKAQTAHDKVETTSLPSCK
eukprot:gene13096-8942_t